MVTVSVKESAKVRFNFQKNLLENASPHYSYVVEAAQSEFTEEALSKLSQYLLEQKRWEEAIPLLKRLEEEASFLHNVIFAQSNLMKANYQLDNYDAAVSYAEKVLSSSTIDNKVKSDAHIIIARSAMKTGNEEKAKQAYIKVEKVATVNQENTKKTVVKSLENTRQSYLKYAAIFVVGISLIALGGIEVNKNYQSALGTQKVQEDRIKSSKIETATFQIDQSLPTLKVNLQEKKVEKTPVEVIAVNKPFHVIAGAFRDQKNAQKKVNDLLAKGYKAELLGVNKWNLHQVSFGAFETRLQADQTLKQVRKSGTPDAWVLKSK